MIPFGWHHLKILKSTTNQTNYSNWLFERTIQIPTHRGSLVAHISRKLQGEQSARGMTISEIAHSLFIFQLLWSLRCYDLFENRGYYDCENGSRALLSFRKFEFFSKQEMFFKVIFLSIQIFQDLNVFQLEVFNDTLMKRADYHPLF